ncbi:putative DNA primase/helicase [Bradyrhizobium sp. USDA 4524]|uniref:toprim domain-containing protein n=1 Tax=unclassified Bradyrhizobium TaxID=2631580 RepID=UPI00209F383F|nr:MULTISPECIES: toprim domain-containing protein [unclassified Bradyrhizobium]MCP1841304.1 phage/plasmid primase-like uncharacterized protein [Bradyrhizobium sp. USDA 4538]MCP1901867.1 phage/plasmid primase-like uncharacterized protein [Bradyrhizobium sp. USDA 4537]MCP1992476.1 phage/plasmid primase-like uncharacterized protein [Bradyrhizobium sp. USDA 4539]
MTMQDEADRIGIALKGRKSAGGWLVRCPVPTHGKGRGDRSPSLSIHGGDGKLLLKCFAGCSFDDVLDELRARNLVDAPRISTARAALARVTPEPTEHKPDPAALHFIDECEPPQDTAAEEYLQRRGIPILPKSLLFHRPSLSLVAVLQRPDGLAVALQRTMLTPGGEKASVNPCKITMGALGAGAVRLDPAAQTMGIAEGVETALSAQIMTGMPVWASLGASRLHRVEVPETVRELHIFSDNDQPGLTAAKRTADANQRSGRRVLIRTPPDAFKDYNDFLNALADYDGDGDRLLATFPEKDAAA